MLFSISTSGYFLTFITLIADNEFQDSAQGRENNPRVKNDHGKRALNDWGHSVYSRSFRYIGNLHSNRPGL
jgi:hypothetical protein